VEDRGCRAALAACPPAGGGARTPNPNVDGEELEGGSEDARGRSMDGEELRHQGTRLGREHRGRIEMGWRRCVG